MNLIDSFTLVSLALTPATIILSGAVVLLWGQSAIRAVNLSDRDDFHWLILGVTIGFLGSIVDNLYWGIAWTADFIGADNRDWWFEHGSASNVIFRQFCGIAAAFCHVQAARASDARVIKSAAILCALVGVLFVLTLTALR